MEYPLWNFFGLYRIFGFSPGGYVDILILTLIILSYFGLIIKNKKIVYTITPPAIVITFTILFSEFLFLTTPYRYLHTIIFLIITLPLIFQFPKIYPIISKGILKYVILFLAILLLAMIVSIVHTPQEETNKYEQLLCIGAIYNSNVPNVHGVNWVSSINNFSESVTDYEFSIAKQIGFNIIRTPPVYNYTDWYKPPLIPGDSRIVDYMNMTIRLAGKYDMKIIPMLLDDNALHNLEADIDDLKTHVKAIVEQHVGDETIYAWDVVNEPQLWREPHRQKTLELVRYVKELDPTAKVTLGLIQNTEKKHLNEIADELDIISFHYYPYLELNDGTSPYTALENLINKYKQWGKPVLVSETGLKTNEPYTEKHQECWYYGALDVIKKSNISGYITFALKDFRTMRTDFFPFVDPYRIGIVRLNTTFKPAVNAFP